MIYEPTEYHFSRLAGTGYLAEHIERNFMSFLDIFVTHVKRLYQ